MSDALVVVDASAILCVINGERGWDEVEARSVDAYVSTINLAEVYTKLTERGVAAATADRNIAAQELRVVPFDSAQARAAGLLRATTRSAGLSLGDRACLALAIARGGVALTTDRAWAKLGPEFPVELVR